MVNNPENRQQWIFDLLKVEPMGFSDCFSKYLENFSKSEVTFSKDWNIANERYLEYRNKANKAKDDISIANEVEVLKQGLKSKTDRLLEKQKDVDRLRESVNNGFTEDFYISNGEHVLFQRPMTETEKSTILKRATEIEDAISKIESDYAPTKTAQTDVSGNDAKIKVIGIQYID